MHNISWKNRALLTIGHFVLGRIRHNKPHSNQVSSEPESQTSKMSPQFFWRKKRGAGQESNILHWKLTIKYVHHSEEGQRQGWLAAASTTTDPNLQEKAGCYLFIERSHKSGLQSIWESWTGLLYCWGEISSPMASCRLKGLKKTRQDSKHTFLPLGIMGTYPRNIF